MVHSWYKRSRPVRNISMISTVQRRHFSMSSIPCIATSSSRKHCLCLYKAERYQYDILGIFILWISVGSMWRIEPRTDGATSFLAGSIFRNSGRLQPCTFRPTCSKIPLAFIIFGLQCRRSSGIYLEEERSRSLFKRGVTEKHCARPGNWRHSTLRVSRR